MIVSLSISNFRSFLDEQTLSLVASKRLSGTHDQHAIPIPDSDEKVLRTAVIYGANGAGKSNVLKALEYVKNVALRPRKNARGMRRDVFRFDEQGKGPSSFDIQFIARDRHFRFGFSVDDERIIEEWLVVVSGTREKAIYERATDEQGKVNVDATGFKSNPKLDALRTVGGPPNQSFLATIKANLQPEDFSEEIAAALEWMDNGLTLISPDSSYSFLSEILSTDAAFRSFAGSFLKEAATGVDHLDIEKKPLAEEQLRALLPPELLPEILKRIAEGRASGVRLPHTEIVFEKEGEDRIFQVTIKGAHRHGRDKIGTLDFFEESDGTQRLLDLLPALYDLKTDNAVYFIDEIDRSMHPMLVSKFMEFFLRLCTGKACQVIATTHETNLLTHDLLRRDEIWFAEKNEGGATQLYSLTDYQVRKDLQIRKGYMEGRFGAVPFLSGLDRLLEAHNESECP